MALRVQQHVKLTANDFRNINKIISNHWRYHKAEDPTTSLSQALNEEVKKILSRPENQNRRVAHETLFQTPPGDNIQPPLFEAVRQGCIKSLLYFLTRFGEVIDFASATEPRTFLTSSSLRSILHDSGLSVHGSSILNAACHIRDSERCIEIVEILVSRGASVNSRDCYNHTPLMEAAGVDNVEVLKYLVDQGSIVNACDKGGCTALFYAASSSHNGVNAIRYLVSKGANITHRSKLGYTALHFAALHGKLQAVKELLALGASPEFVKVDSLKPNYVPPPLLLAASHRHRKVVDVFLEHQDCTTELRIDALLLLGCSKYVDSVEPLWREALTLREKCLASIHFLPPLEAFGGRTEMRTTADLDAVMASKADTQYQTWIIRERCIGKLEPNEVIDSCVLVLELFRSSEYSEAEMLAKHVLKKLLSLVPLLPPDMRAYELSHSGVSILYYSLICINVTVPNMINVTNGKGPNMVLFVKYSLRCLELIVDAANSQSCEENHSLSTMVSGILEIFAHWYYQQVVRKTNNAAEASTEVPDQEYRSLLHQFVSTCLSQSQYVAILHDAVYCKVKYIAEVVRSVLECGGSSVINALNKRGWRPLHVAVQSSKHEFVSLFLEFGAHVDAVNREGSSAAEVAPRRNTKTIQMLSDFLPLPLTCQASRTVIATEIPYELFDLPLHIKNFIKLHDKHAH